MKGLTPAEYEQLRGFVTRVGDHPVTESERRLFVDLVEQRRCEWIPTPTERDVDGYWAITPAGREALRLWPLVKAAMGGSR